MNRILIVTSLLLGLVGLGESASRTPAAPAGLAGEWRFSEGSGISAADSTGNAAAATLTNGVAWSSGRIGGGVSLDGANDYVNLGSNLDTLRNVPAATLACWVKIGTLPANGASMELLGFSIGAANPTASSRARIKLLGTASGAILVGGGRSSDGEALLDVQAPGTTLVAGTWIHLAGVLDYAGKTIRLYVNGSLAASGAAAFAANASSNTASRSAAIGAEENGSAGFYSGLLDEARVYGRALSAAELQALASAEALAARWTFDEGAGLSAGDSSGNAIPGTLRNGTAWTGGLLGSALHFDGANDFVDLGPAPALLRNANGATVSAWVRPGSTIPAGSFRELVSISVGGAAPTNVSRLALSLQGDGTGGDLFVGGRSTDTETQKTLTANTNLVPGTWAHVAGVVDYAGGTISIYLNGELVASGPAPFTQNRSANTAPAIGAIGAQDTGDSNFFQGDLDDVRIYGRALAACDVADLAMKDGLHLHLKMDEGSGLTTADASGHGGVATLKNDVAWGAGQFGQALSFDGANDYVDLGANLDFLSATSGATVSAWVKPGTLPASGAFQDLVSLSVNSPGGPTDTSRLALSLKGDGTAADLFAGARSTDAEAQQTATADANLASGSWVHVAAVISFSHNTIVLYKNGAPILTQTVAFSQPMTPATPSTNGALGAQDKGDGNFFSGLLDEVRVYCRSLSPSEIAALAAPGVPAAPNLTAANPGDARVDLVWTAVAGATSYNVKRATAPGGPFVTIANVATTTYPDLTVVNGTSYTYKVTALNVAGEGPDSNTRTAIPTAPVTLPAPVIVSPVGPVNTATPSIVGTSSAPGLTITVFVDGVVNGTSTSAVAGNWGFVPALALAQGPHTLTARASNGVQTSAMSAPVSINVDTIAPSITNFVPANGSTVFGATTTISASWSDVGTGIALGTATISLDDVLVTLQATTTATGFSFSAGSLGGGTHTVQATIQDGAANATTVSWTFQVALPPGLPGITAPLNGAFLNTALPVVSGTSTGPGQTITLLVDGTPRGSTLGGGGGLWSLTPSQPIPDGPHALTAQASNAAGSSAPSAAVNVTIDTAAPIVSNPFPPNLSSVFATNPAIAASWSDAGSGLDLSTAQVLLDGVVVLTNVTATDFSFQPLLGAGTHTVTASIRDRAGNLGTLSWQFTVVIAPPAPVITSPANGSNLLNPQPAVSGTSSGSGLTITLTVDNVPSGTTTSGAGGAWSLTPATVLADGIHLLRATAGNAAGTSAPSAAVSIRIDTQQPAISNLFPVPGSTITNPNPVMSGSWSDSGSGLNLATANFSMNPGTVLNPVAGPSGFSFSAGTLANGTYSAGLYIRDNAGNETIIGWVFTVNAAAPDPTPPVVDFLIPSDGALVNTKRPQFTAQASDAGGSGMSSFTMKIDGSPSGAVATFPNADHAVLLFTPTTDLTETTHTVEVTARDGAGNTTTVLHTFTIDATVPVVTVSVQPPDPTVPTKTITATFSDPHLDPAQRKVLIDLADRTTDGVFSGNTWTFTGMFSVAPHSVVAQARDTYGNFGQATANFTVTPPPASDTTPPVATLIYPDSFNNGFTAGQTLQAVVLARDNAAGDSGIQTVQLLFNGSVVGTKTAADAQRSFYYTFQVPLPNAPNTNIQVSARATDQSGNQTLTSSQSVHLSGPVQFYTVKSFRVQAPASVESGTSFPVTVTFLNAQNSPTPVDLLIKVRNTFDSSFLTINVATQSQITFPLTIGGTGVGIIEVYDPFDTGLTGTSLITLTGGAPAHIEVEIFREDRLSPGSTLSEIRATVTDAAGNPVPDTQVTWTVEFFQNGVSLGTQTFTATTDANGVAVIPGVVVPENSTQVTAGASVPTSGGGTTSSSASNPVVPNVIFNIAFAQQAVEAGMPLSFTISALDPDTGLVVTDYTGTVYVYRYNKHVLGPATVDGESASDGEKLTITFTADDMGVKFVEDGIILLQRGETVLVASTEAPQWKKLSTIEEFEFGADESFATIDLEELTDAPSTIGGISNEVVVVPTRPAHFVSLSLFTEPIHSETVLVDRFGNPVFLEPVSFEFEINGGAAQTWTSPTNVAGFTEAYGPTNLDSSQDNTVKVTVKAPRYPSSNPDGVPSVSTTRNLGKQDEDFGVSTLDAESPAVIELGQPDQPVADLKLRRSGHSCDETVSLFFSIHLNSEQNPGVKFTAATFTSDDAELDGDLTIEDQEISGTIKNIEPLEPTLDEDGFCIQAAPFDLHFKIEGILVDVADDGRIPTRHPDGRLTASAFRSPDIRTIAYFGKTLNFIGAVVPAGTPALQGTGNSKPAGVWIIDAEEARRAMVINPGLIAANDSSRIAGTFRVQVMDRDLTVSDDLKIKLESTDKDGNPILDPITQETLEGTEVFVPLKVQTERDPGDSESTTATTLVTLPVIAVDRGFQAPESVAGKPGKFRIATQSSVPSDGQTKARIDVFVTYEDGTPAEGVSVTLGETDPRLPVSPEITQPPATDASGRSHGFVKSSVPGTACFTVSGSVPTLDAEHQGYSLSDSPKLRILFFDDIRTVIAVPGGKIKATLYQGNDVASGFSDKTKDAVGLGVEIKVKPESESTSRPAACAIWKGTSPQIEFNFVPSIDVFGVPDPSAPPPPFPSNDPNLLKPQHALSIIVDSGDDGDSASRSQETDKRIVAPDVDPWKQQFTKNGNVLTWRPSGTETPLRLGANRIRAITLQGGPAIAVAPVLIYDDEHPIQFYSFAGASTPQTVSNLSVSYERNTLLVLAKRETTDTQISNFMREHHLKPVGCTRDLGAVATRIPETADEDLLVRAAELDGVRDGAQIAGVTADPLDSEDQAATVDAATEAAPPRLIADFELTGAGGVRTGRYVANTAGLYHLFLTETLPAHALVAKLRGTNPVPTAAIIDRGYGRGRFDAGSGAAFTDTNALSVAGNRLVNPTDVRRHAVLGALPPSVSHPAGSLHLIDFDPPEGREGITHGANVLSFMAGDGRGSATAPDQVVLGSGVHLNVRCLSTPLSAHRDIQALGILAGDADVRVINMSRGGEDGALPAALRATYTDAVRACVLVTPGGNQTPRALVVSAGNPPVGRSSPVPADNRFPQELGAINTVPRQSQGGADADVRRNVVVVTATNAGPLDGSVPEPGAPIDRRSGAAFGNRISVCAPGSNVRVVNYDGRTYGVRPISGTSFSSPFTAGILGEMMLVRPALRDNPELAIEMLEATADDLRLPTTTITPDRGAAVQATSRDQQGHGMVNFWKAVLAAANGGISAQPGRTGGGNDAFFTNVPVIEEGTGSQWYGFKILSPIPNATVWIRDAAGTARQVVDGNAAGVYPVATAGTGPVTHAAIQPQFLGQDPNLSRPLPAYTFGESALNAVDLVPSYAVRFSIQRSQLGNNDPRFQLELRRPDQNVFDSSFFAIPLDLVAMRTSQLPGVLFDDWVFTIQTQAVGVVEGGSPARFTLLDYCTFTTTGTPPRSTLTHIESVNVGNGGLGVAFNHRGTVAAISNSAASSASFVDIFKSRVFSTAPVGGGPGVIRQARPGSGAPHTDGYVVNHTDRSVGHLRMDEAGGFKDSTIDVKNDLTSIGGLGVGDAAEGANFYVTGRGPDTLGPIGKILRFNTSNQQTGMYLYPGTTFPVAMEIMPGGLTGFVADGGEGKLYVHDILTPSMPILGVSGVREIAGDDTVFNSFVLSPRGSYALATVSSVLRSRTRVLVGFNRMTDTVPRKLQEIVAFDGVRSIAIDPNEFFGFVTRVSGADSEVVLIRSNGGSATRIASFDLRDPQGVSARIIKDFR